MCSINLHLSNRRLSTGAQVPAQLASLAPALTACLLRKGVRIVSQRYEIPGLNFTCAIGSNAHNADSDDLYFQSEGRAFLYGPDSTLTPEEILSTPRTH